MKHKYLMIGLALIVMGLPLYAEENQEENEYTEVSPYYMAVKFMLSRGGMVKEEETTLDSNQAKGVGLDIGYKVNPHFAVELAGSYGSNDVKKSEEGMESETVSADYYSYGINLVFSQEIWEEFGFFAKLGYEKEHETISDLDISELEDGIDYAIGFNYEMDESKAVLIEYEKTTIDGLLGDVVYAGVEYKF